MNRDAKPVFHREIPRLVHNQLRAERQKIWLQIAPEEWEDSMPASSDAWVILKMPLLDIATIPLLTPPIAEDLAVPMLIVGDWEPSDQKVSEAIACKMPLECFQDVGCRPELRNLKGGLSDIKD